MAKSDVGVLTIALEAVTGDFDKGLKTAEGNLKGFKGSIEGWGKTFTEMSAKLNIFGAGTEIAFGGAAAAVKLFKGDFEGALEQIERLPIIGGTVGFIRDFADALSGAAERAKRLEEIAKAGKAWQDYTDRAIEGLNKLRDALKGVTLERAASEEMLQAERLRAQGGDLSEVHAWESQATETAFDKTLEDLDQKWANTSKSLGEQLEKDLKAATEDSIRAEVLADLMVDFDKKALEAGLDLESSGVKLMRDAMRGNVIETDFSEEAEKRAAAVKEQHAEAMAAARALHEEEKNLAGIAYERNEIAEAQRQSKELEAEQAKKAAEAARIAKEEQERILAIERERLKLQKEIGAAQRKAHTVRQQSVSGRSDSFSSPMGTIQLPSMTSAVELARKQLTELGQIEAQIRNLRAEIKALAA